MSIISKYVIKGKYYKSVDTNTRIKKYNIILKRDIMSYKNLIEKINIIILKNQILKVEETDKQIIISYKKMVNNCLDKISIDLNNSPIQIESEINKPTAFLWYVKKELYDTLKNTNDTIKIENSKLKRDLESYKNIIKILNNIVSKNQFKILGIEEDKEHNLVLIYQEISNKFLDIYVATSYDQKIIHFESIVNKDSASIANIIIDDKYCSKGYATLAMTHFLNEVKKLNVKTINGTISAYYEKNYYRQKPFYEKFGFKVERNEETKWGCITKVFL